MTHPSLDDVRSAVEDFKKELEEVINRYSMENASNTPDFILANYLLDCLNAFNQACQMRETWYGRDARPGEIKIPLTDLRARLEK